MDSRDGVGLALGGIVGDPAQILEAWFETWGMSQPISDADRRL
jgi:hypothetical protein